MGGLVMTTQEVAQALRVDQSTLVRWRVNNEGPAFVRMGGRVRYRPSAIEAWLEGNTINPQRDVKETA